MDYVYCSKKENLCLNLIIFTQNLLCNFEEEEWRLVCIFEENQTNKPIPTRVGDQGIEPCTSRTRIEHSTDELVPEN